MATTRARATQPPESEHAWSPASTRPRLVWGLVGEKTGDNRQVEQLVASLGHAYELKRLSYRPLRHLPNFLLGATRSTLRSRSSAALAPPWPDLVVAAGRRSAPVARWIREQGGGKTRLVHLGRPRATLAAFDLVVTTPQYGLPEVASVQMNTLPFQRAHEPDAEQLTDWRDAFERLPRPWIGVLVGGETWPLRFSVRAAEAMGRQISTAAAARGGTLLITTSPRTGADRTAALFRAVEGPALRNDWRSDRPGCYAGILALADAFIVTEDSMSMLAEACRSGKPVEIYPLGRRGGPWVWLADRWNVARGDDRGRYAILERLARSGVLAPPRNVRRVSEALISRGAAVDFDPVRPPPTGSAPLWQDEMQNTIARVKALLDADASARPAPVD